MIVSPARPPSRSSPAAAAAAVFTTHCCCYSSPISSGLRVLEWYKNTRFNFNNHRRHRQMVRRRRLLECRASLEQDAPFAAAIGACVLNSLVFPFPSRVAENDFDEEGGPLDNTDMRLGVMGIISLIPYFNWLSWVFAWLDTGRQRYLVYTIVYLVPYLRTNLSLSPEESWLPIASIVVCVIHIQLEASIRNGDLDDIQFLTQIQKLLYPLTGKKGSSIQKTRGSSQKAMKKDRTKLPSSHGSRDKLREWEVPHKSDERQKDKISDWDVDD